MKENVALVAMIAAIAMLLLFPFWAPCGWLGWMSMKDLPARCLSNAVVKR
jgi:hypothetical protein